MVLEKMLYNFVAICSNCISDFCGVMIMTEDDIQLAKPSLEHFEAFKKAQESMSEYIGKDIIQAYQEVPEDNEEARESFKNNLGDVAKSESMDFPFTDSWYSDCDKETFENKFVKNYENKSKDDAKNPEAFYFIMKGQEIIGCIAARSRNIESADIKNGVTGFDKWERNGKKKKVEISNLFLPEHRGKGYAGKTMEKFFEKLNSLGIKEVSGTVIESNESSHKAQGKLVGKFGGRTFKLPNGDTRYIVNTDISKKDKSLENASKVLPKHIVNLRNGNNSNISSKESKSPYKSTTINKEMLDNIRGVEK